MRASPLAALLLLGACGGGASSNVIMPRNEAGIAVNTVPPVVGARNEAAPVPAKKAAPAEPPEIPGVAEMSPYRRREYERGYRDCRRGAFDRERQGESYRIGCMAAEEARER